MPNVNFVPDEYIQSGESRRANFMYLALFAVVMAALGSVFMTIKVRQGALIAKEKLVNAKMTRTEKAIKQFEELQAKRQVMMKTVLTTASLLEPIPRSVLLASLTNSLPRGVSFLRLNIVQKEPKTPRHVAATNKYEKAQAKKKPKDVQPEIPPERLLETYIDIEGIAPSDIQVAAYIEQLSGSDSLLDNVALVESKEYGIEGSIFRRFKLTAVIKKNANLAIEDIVEIETKSEGDVLLSVAH
ncbi:MAG: hypothetical protein PHY02_05105 [Phycisphaerae bacterium]|nr:hypothetical protein [Phycisphaerae bacterium]